VTGSVARVVVPATSANLGPGFDILGLALELYDDYEAQVTDGPTVVHVSGEGAGVLPTDDRHLVLRAMACVAAELGRHLPHVELACTNRIPQERGLGSSAAAIVGGIRLAQALLGDSDDKLALAVATRMEGHPDNIAPALFGGLRLSYTDRGQVRSVELAVVANLAVSVLVPSSRSVTEEVRGLIPGTVSHADAVANSARIALLVEALGRRPDLLLDATEDFLHQRYRASAMPQTADLVGLLRAQQIPAVVSGAGPCVLAFAGELPIDVPDGWQWLPLAIDRQGAQLTWR
jgi:homoserine kinase